MGDPNAPALDALAMIEALDRHGVDYVLVGGLAATLYGAVRLTTDMDVVPDWTQPNRARLAAALKELHAQLRVPGQKETVPFPLDASSFTSFEVSTWRTDCGDIDIIIGIPSSTRGHLNGYGHLASRAEHHQLDNGPTILVGELDDIIESKTALGRPTDLVVLEELWQLRNQRERDRSAVLRDRHDDPGLNP